MTQEPSRLAELTAPLSSATSHTFTVPGLFSLNLTFLLGEDFDTDPTLPWARPYLTAPGPISTRLAQLGERALAEARRAAGDPS